MEARGEGVSGNGSCEVAGQGTTGTWGEGQYQGTALDVGIGNSTTKHCCWDDAPGNPVTCLDP